MTTQPSSQDLRDSTLVTEDTEHGAARTQVLKSKLHRVLYSHMQVASRCGARLISDGSNDSGTELEHADTER